MEAELFLPQAGCDFGWNFDLISQCESRGREIDAINVNALHCFHQCRLKIYVYVVEL
jgi:hypothetical protein